MAQEVRTMVEGGKASTGPPLGPALGPLGLNLGQVVKEINEKTKDFAGMQVPIILTVLDATKKTYEIRVGVPPTSALLKKELGIQTASGKRREVTAGDATLEQIKKVALSSSNLRNNQIFHFLSQDSLLQTFQNNNLHQHNHQACQTKQRLLHQIFSIKEGWRIY